MSKLTDFGNDLYTGKLSVPFVARRKLWFGIAIVAVLLSALLPFLRGGFNLGIEFTGGSEFRISAAANPDPDLAASTVEDLYPDAEPTVTVVGDSDLRVRTVALTDAEVTEVTDALVTAFDVTPDDVASSFVGASWGQDVSLQALRALVVFLVLVSIAMALYFRTWKMSAAALIKLLFDLVVTIGVYGAVGFEVTPAAVIGVLTILSYSLYDAVVVFDKIRENTATVADGQGAEFAHQVNLAVNQTLVRSINTSVIGALPVLAILVIGTAMIGTGTLQDIALALLVGILAGTWSTLFLGAPLYSLMREREPRFRGAAPVANTATAKA